MPKPLQFLRDRSGDINLVLMLAAGLTGVYAQAALPAQPGAEMWTLAKNLAYQGAFANPFQILPTGPTAANPPLYPFFLAILIKVLGSVTLYGWASILGTILANIATAVLLPRASVVFFGDAVPGVFASLLWIASMQSMPGWDMNYTVGGPDRVLPLYRNICRRRQKARRSRSCRGSPCRSPLAGQPGYDADHSALDRVSGCPREDQQEMRAAVLRDCLRGVLPVRRGMVPAQ